VDQVVQDQTLGRSLCCVLGQDTVLQCLSPPSSITGYWQLMGQPDWMLRSNLRWTKIMDESLGTNLHFWGFCAHARREYNFTCLTSPPTPHTMLKTSTCNFTWFLILCWVGRGVSTTFLKDIAGFFPNFSSKTQTIRYITWVSQGLSSTIVWFSRLVENSQSGWFLALNAFRTRECEHLSLERHF